MGSIYFLLSWVMGGLVDSIVRCTLIETSSGQNQTYHGSAIMTIDLDVNGAGALL